MKPEENCRLLRVEKRQCSPVYNNGQPHLHNPPHPERRKREREREKLGHALRPRLAVSSLTALLKAKGWIAVCSPALPFGVAQNCGSVMSIDPNAHTGHQRRFLAPCDRWVSLWSDYPRAYGPESCYTHRKFSCRAPYTHYIDFIVRGMRYLVQEIKQYGFIEFKNIILFFGRYVFFVLHIFLYVTLSNSRGQQTE